MKHSWSERSWLNTVPAVTTADVELTDVTLSDVTSAGVQCLTLKRIVEFSPASRSSAVTVASTTPTSIFSDTVTYAVKAWIGISG